MRRALAIYLAAAAGLIASACTMKNTEAPGLTGPSEFGQSITISITPDILTQDGASQSVITITARDPNGQPIRNLPLRVEIAAGGTLADFGSLSARSVVTGSDGRATVVYTAPPSANVSTDPFTTVSILVTPVGSDFGNSSARSASIRLVPPGIIVPPDGLAPSFTFNPASPSDNQAVLFDASASTSNPNNPIAAYAWDFGDGETGTGRQVSHSFRSPGTYVVRLTISDAVGRSASTAQSVTVAAGTAPTASFTISPVEPLPNQAVHFNASSSRAAAGRRIVSYRWDFGDGTPAGSGVQESHTYTAIGTYTVTLEVTDDAGRTATASLEVPVGIVEESVTGLTKKGR